MWLAMDNMLLMNWVGGQGGSGGRRERGLDKGMSGSVCGPEHFNIYINVLKEDTEGMLLGFLDETKLGGMTNVIDDRHEIQNGLYSL